MGTEESITKKRPTSTLLIWATPAPNETYGRTSRPQRAGAVTSTSPDTVKSRLDSTRSCAENADGVNTVSPSIPIHPSDKRATDSPKPACTFFAASSTSKKPGVVPTLADANGVTTT